MNTKDCEVCGNPIHCSATKCPFCESVQTGSAGKKGAPKVITINIETGRPTVEEAIQRFDQEFNKAILGGAHVLRVIHGYGSTGVGGKIGLACRALLQRRLHSKKMTLLRGEDYCRSSLVTLDLLRQYPEMKKSERTDTNNPGITFVIL